MTIKSLPAAPSFRPHARIQSDLLPKALESWNPAIKAAAEDETTITMYDPIGEDWWTGNGVTAKRVSAALRNIGDRDVTVKINSPGGDVFEGLAIYNLLREHKGKVTVQVIGLAASAASFIAMAADEVQIARSAFLMIHNAWTVAGGDRNDMREVADFLEQIDSTLADIYATKTGADKAELSQMMDVETWLGGSAAIEEGFADSLLESDQTKEDPKASAPQLVAARRLDTILAQSGMSRSERRNLIAELKGGTPSAATSGTPSATDQPAELAEPLAELQRALDRFSAAALKATGVQ